MRPTECSFEAEVLAAVVQSRWPDRVDEQLRAHAAKCPICSDTATVASAIDELSEATNAAAAIPDASRVWWRAQMRMRREAVEAAGRPITVAQLVALASGVGLVGACFGATSTWFQTALNRLLSMPSAFEVSGVLASANGVMSEWGVWIAVAVAVLLLLPAGLYVTVLRD